MTLMYAMTIYHEVCMCIAFLVRQTGCFCFTFHKTVMICLSMLEGMGVMCAREMAKIGKKVKYYPLSGRRR